MCLVSDAFPTSKKLLVGWQFVLRWGQIEKARVDTGRPPRVNIGKTMPMLTRGGLPVSTRAC